MKSNYIFQSIIIGLISMVLFSFSWASERESSLVLQAAPKHPGASGTAVIDKDHISVQARGLKPDAVYTVWFVNMKPKKSEAGAGTAPFMFRTDKWGDGQYSAPLMASPFGKWSMLMVVLHPSGDPKDMHHMVGALKAPL